MRQSDHVSLETGRRLKEAGLKWAPAMGDWYACVDGVWDCRVRVIDDDDQARYQQHRIHEGDQPASYWLPSTGQLLEALKARGLRPQLAWLDKWVVLFHISAGWLTVEHGHPAEALAEAWLRLHVAKGGDA